MVRSTTKQEEKEFKGFLEELKGEGILAEVFHGHNEAIRKHCGSGFYRVVKEALLQSGHRQYRLVFEEKKGACWISEDKPDLVVINMASIAKLNELLPNVARWALEEAALVKKGVLK